MHEWNVLFKNGHHTRGQASWDWVRAADTTVLGVGFGQQCSSRHRTQERARVVVAKVEGRALWVAPTKRPMPSVHSAGLCGKSSWSVAAHTKRPMPSVFGRNSQCQPVRGMNI
jgi:hypothetical protein